MSNKRDARIGFITGRSGSIVDGRLMVDAGLGRLLDALNSQVSSFVVGLSLSDTPQRHHDTQTRIHISSVVPLPYMPSTVRALPHGAACRRAIAEIERRVDASIIQYPFAPPWALLPSSTPRVFHACADTPAIVRASPYRSGVARQAAVAMADLMHSWQRALLRAPRTALVANGEALRERLAPHPGAGRAVVSATILQNELGSVVRQRTDDRFRVLFVGFLRPEKGLDVLVESFARVKARVKNAELIVVGDAGLTEERAQDALLGQLKRFCDEGAASCVGRVDFGPSLFQHFADADVLVLPSRSEGTPRVLVEARAFGCPVVASRVGGIPTSVADGIDGLLVESGDSAGFAEALLRVHDDAALRETLVAGGLARAAQNTVEAFASVLLDDALALLNAV